MITLTFLVTVHNKKGLIASADGTNEGREDSARIDKMKNLQITVNCVTEIVHQNRRA